eukprot:jgi/Psemu1/13229/gm1.13229_g
MDPTDSVHSLGHRHRLLDGNTNCALSTYNNNNNDNDNDNETSASSPPTSTRRHHRHRMRNFSGKRRTLATVLCAPAAVWLLLSTHSFVCVGAIGGRVFGRTAVPPPLTRRRRGAVAPPEQAQTTTDSPPNTNNDELRSDKNKPSVSTSFLDNLFQKGSYDRKEAIFVVIAAAIIGLNTGFLNGVTLSAAFLKGTDSVSIGSKSSSSSSRGTMATLNPATDVVAGTAGSLTKNALALADWPRQSSVFWYTLGMVGSYMGGACLAGFINEGAQKHVIEPRYGPTFLIGGICLSVAELLARTGMPSRFVFFLATASLGIQNAIASLYSANLIRCTMTGVTTDVGLSLGQCLRGDFRNLSRGMVLGGVVLCFWIGGILASPSVSLWKHHTLLINAGVFFALGILCTVYLTVELGVTLRQALTGGWRWKEVLKHLDPNRDGGGRVTMTRGELRNIFDELTGIGGIGDTGGIGAPDYDEDDDTRRRHHISEAQLRARLEEETTLRKISPFQAKVLVRAADTDQNGSISFAEWEEITSNLLQLPETN